MVDEIAKTVVRMVMKLIKPTIKILLWTYLWIPLAGFIIADMVGVAGGSWLFTLIMVLSLFAWLWLFIQRLVRLGKKDPSFSFLALLLGQAHARKEKQMIDPKVNKDFLSPSPEGGYPVGKKGRLFCVLPDKGPGSQFHALIVGGSGSGKTSTQLIPLLLKSQLPAFVVDPKGELYEKTAPILSKRAKIKVFNPADPSAWGYDPFGAVRKESAVLDMTTIANALLPLTPGTKEDTAFWINEAQTFLASMLLFFWENEATFTQAMRTIQSTPAEKLVEAAMKNGSEDVKVLCGHYSGMAPETLYSIFSQLTSKTVIFASDPDIMRCFDSDKVIRPEDLAEGTTVFFQIREDRMTVYRNVSQLIIQQFMTYWERQPDSSGGDPRVNFVLEELPRLGKLPFLQNSLALARSKGCRIFGVVQSLAQLEEIYDRVGARAMADNFSVKVLLSASEPESQKYFASLIGDYDKRMRSTSANQQVARLGANQGVSYSEQERKILRPETLGRLGDECILFLPGGWGRIRKTPYYSTKEFQE